MHRAITITVIRFFLKAHRLREGPSIIPAGYRTERPASRKNHFGSSLPVILKNQFTTYSTPFSSLFILSGPLGDVNRKLACRHVFTRYPGKHFILPPPDLFSPAQTARKLHLPPAPAPNRNGSFPNRAYCIPAAVSRSPHRHPNEKCILRPAVKRNGAFFHIPAGRFWQCRRNQNPAVGQPDYSVVIYHKKPSCGVHSTTFSPVLPPSGNDAGTSAAVYSRLTG